MNKEPHINKFDRKIKDVLENYEVEFNPEHWKEFQNEYATGRADKRRYPKNLRNKMISGAIAVLVISGLAFYLNTLVNKQDRLKLQDENPTGVTVEKQQKSANPEVMVLQDEPSSDNNVQPVNIVSEEKRQVVINNERHTDNTERVPLPQIQKDEPLHEKTEGGGKLVALDESSIKVDRLVSCSSGIINMEVVNPMSGADYHWMVNNNYAGKGIANSYQVNEGGVYNISLEGNNRFRKQVAVELEIPENPVADFSWKTISGNNFALGFSDNSTRGDNEYYWDFGDNQFSNLSNPVHVYLSKGTYRVQLIVKNHRGCADTIIKTVLIEDINPLLAPNAFSPDGDGLNDFFLPRSLEINNESFEMFIYDRNGVLIYKTNDRSKPWDGRNYNTGELYASGNTFVWVVIMKDQNNNTQNYSGNVSIIK